MSGNKHNNWSKHLEDSSIPGGLKRCLLALRELWGTNGVSLFVREPGSSVFEYDVSEDGDLQKVELRRPGENIANLLQLSVPAERYYDQRHKILYLRQRRADKPHAVLRISDVESTVGENLEIAESTRAILMAAVAYVESYAYIQSLQEPLVADRLKSDFRTFIVPICEQISKRSFLATVGFLNLHDASATDLLYGEHYQNGSISDRAYGRQTINGISDIIRGKKHSSNQLEQIISPALGRLRHRDDGFLEGVDYILYYRIDNSYFSGVVFFGIPSEYEITEADAAIMKFIKDQFLNYVFIYTSYNEERYLLYKQQQEFGLEYAQEFTQVARHAARSTVGDIVNYAYLLNLIAQDGEADEKGRLEAYDALSLAVDKMENVYDEVKSLADTQLPLDKINVRDIFDDIAASFHAEFKDKHIKFINELNGAETIVAYEQQMKVALFNLVQNSCEAFERNKIPEKKRSIIVSHSGRKTRPIVYADNAGGIKGLRSPSGEELPDQQKAWMRGVSSRGGSGFGMHLIKRYLETNSCKVSMIPTNNGTRFLIEIEEIRQ